jgi:hypothetical protein
MTVVRRRRGAWGRTNTVVATVHVVRHRVAVRGGRLARGSGRVLRRSPRCGLPVTDVPTDRHLAVGTPTGPSPASEERKPVTTSRRRPSASCSASWRVTYTPTGERPSWTGRPRRSGTRAGQGRASSRVVIRVIKDKPSPLTGIVRAERVHGHPVRRPRLVLARPEIGAPGVRRSLAR